MDEGLATDSLGALAHPARLALFRTLIAAAPDGVASGALAETMGVRPTTVSAQLAVLSRAGLVLAERRGRKVLYRVDLGAMRALLGFLMSDCCGGHPEICGGLEIAHAATPKRNETR